MHPDVAADRRRACGRAEVFRQSLAAANDVGVLPYIQALFCRRRRQPRRPPIAKIKPGNPAPAMGPGTGRGPVVKEPSVRISNPCVVESTTKRSEKSNSKLYCVFGASVCAAIRVAVDEGLWKLLWNTT